MRSLCWPKLALIPCSLAELSSAFDNKLSAFKLSRKRQGVDAMISPKSGMMFCTFMAGLVVGSTCSSTNNAPTRSASKIKIDTTALRSIIILLSIGIDASTPKAQTPTDTARSECNVLVDTEKTMVSTTRVVNAPNERKSL